ncbi:hypothetical protein [Rhizobium sp. NRK18]|jgi:hypothetical protein|uniref:hypothetical protein n=1 Tax=Rhizobium sp. NRK18 TaxID=2964667 RepID=UPI0021C3B286|nr:hypothetical protein [Rhizobium sp. NRK18]MCQ2002611.1 hypothetical protein [Rhizobium sp. NRK18]
MTNSSEKDFEIRKMAQDAQLDEDLESMVPPTWKRSTSFFMAVLFCLIALALIAILYVSIG